MKHNLRKITEGGFSAASGITTGTVTAVILSLALVAGLTSLTLSKQISVETVDIPVFFIRAGSVLTGALISTALHKEKMLMNVGIVAAAYLLIITALGIIAFDAGIASLAGGALSVVAGGAAACIIRLTAQKKPRYAGRRRG